MQLFIIPKEESAFAYPKWLVLSLAICVHVHIWKKLNCSIKQEEGFLPSTCTSKLFSCNYYYYSFIIVIIPYSF